MSTSTLLIVSASLRSHASAGRIERPASPVLYCRRGRMSGSGDANAMLISFWRACARSWLLRPLLAARPASPLACAGAWLPLSRARPLVTALLFSLLAPALSVGVAQARSQREDAAPTMVLPTLKVEAEPEPAPEPASRIGGKPPEGPCVQVDIAGHRAGHLDCASQALQEAGRIAQRQARAGLEAPVAGAGSSDTEVGVASLPGTRLRMGRNLGRSVYPDRPNRAPPPTRPGARP